MVYGLFLISFVLFCFACHSTLVLLLRWLHSSFTLLVSFPNVTMLPMLQLAGASFREDCVITTTTTPYSLWATQSETFHYSSAKWNQQDGSHNSLSVRPTRNATFVI